VQVEIKVSTFYKGKKGTVSTLQDRKLRAGTFLRYPSNNKTTVQTLQTFHQFPATCQRFSDVFFSEMF